MGKGLMTPTHGKGKGLMFVHSDNLEGNEHDDTVSDSDSEEDEKGGQSVNEEMSDDDSGQDSDLSDEGSESDPEAERHSSPSQIPGQAAESDVDASDGNTDLNKDGDLEFSSSDDESDCSKKDEQAFVVTDDEGDGSEDDESDKDSDRGAEEEFIPSDGDDEEEEEDVKWDMIFATMLTHFKDYHDDHHEIDFLPNQVKNDHNFYPLFYQSVVKELALETYKDITSNWIYVKNEDFVLHFNSALLSTISDEEYLSRWKITESSQTRDRMYLLENIRKVWSQHDFSISVECIEPWRVADR